MVAQKLYEAGFITYMRTDSTSLSEVAIQSIAQAIVNDYGQNYLQTRRFKSKSANAQEAHEAIRPTYIERVNVTANRERTEIIRIDLEAYDCLPNGRCSRRKTYGKNWRFHYC